MSLLSVFEVRWQVPFSSLPPFSFLTWSDQVQYEIPLGSKAAPGNKLGIFESDDDHYSKADLDVYWSNLEK